VRSCRKAFALKHGWSGSVLQLVEWLAENYPHKFRSDPIPSWQAQARRLRCNKNPHVVLSNYQSFMAATADIREALEESAAAAEREIDAGERERPCLCIHDGRVPRRFLSLVNAASDHLDGNIRYYGANARNWPMAAFDMAGGELMSDRPLIFAKGLFDGEVAQAFKCARAFFRIAESGKLIRVDQNIYDGSAQAPEIRSITGMKFKPFIVGVGKVRVDESPEHIVIFRFYNGQISRVHGLAPGPAEERPLDYTPPNQKPAAFLSGCHPIAKGAPG
jgi:hypothetical protein